MDFVVDSQIKGMKIENISVVKDFVDVFPNDLLSLPPNQEIKFIIDLVSSTTPIFIATYRMALVEFKELKIHFKSFLTRDLSTQVCHLKVHRYSS